MKRSKRKTRSDKFPLTLHPTGQYCKKIKGRIRYFGTDKKQALERYLGQATYLHGCHRSMQMASNGKMTLKELCDLYLKYQNSKLLANNLSPKHHNDQISSVRKLISFLGRGRKIESISTLDLQNYKRKLQGVYGSVYRLNLHISIMKAMFHWARKDDILENIPNIDAISRGKIVHKERFTFNSEQINKLLSAADVKMGETFTVARMDLPAPLGRCLHTTNIIESPHSGVRMRTGRVSRWRDGRMVLRWESAAFLETEKHFKRISGYKQLWMLKSCLDRSEQTEALAVQRKVG